MADLISYSQVLEVLKSIAERSYVINSFYVGDASDFNAADVVYPVLQVQPVIARMPQTNGEYKIINITLKCRIVDNQTQDGTNLDDSHNDLLRVCQDVINEINQHPFYQNSNVLLTGDIQIGPLDEYHDDYLNGWEFDLELQLINHNTFCGLPLADIPGYSISGPTGDIYDASWKYLTCETITGCTNLTNFILNVVNQGISGTTITYVQNGLNTYTGGTSQYPTVNISGGTVNNWNVTGGTLSSGGTDLYSIFVTTNGVNDITRVQPGLNTYTGGTGNNPTVNISAATLTYLSATTISATTFYSGSTDLSSIINSIVTGTTSGLTGSVNVNGLNTYTGGTIANQTINISGGTVNNWNVTGGTLSSGSTDLYNIFLTTADGNDITRVQPGLNTYTGGTGNNPTVNISAATLATLSVSGATSLGVVSATTMFSGSTDLYNIFLTTNDGNDITRVQNGLNTYTGGTGNNPTVNISGATLAYLSATTISATTYYSGSTNLNLIINSIVTGATSSLTSTRVQNGINTFTGGTADLPTVNITAATLNNITVTGTSVFNTISATTISATTYFSAGTNLNTIINSIVTGATSSFIGSTNINGLNTYTGGSTTAQSINISAATLDNLTVTGNTILSATSASTISILNSGQTVIVYNDYSSNRINTGVTFSSIIGGTGNTINRDLSNVNIIGGYKISGTNDNHTYTSNLVVTGTSMGNLYATRIFSGSADISTMFGDITRVQPGTNTYTGGTGNLPTVNISAATLNNLTVSGQTLLGVVSASTFSGGTYLSGGTNLYSIFSTTDNNDITRVQPGTNTYTGGTANNPTVNVSALTINNITVSGATSLATLSATTIISGSTNIANIFVVSGSNVGSAIPIFKQKNGYDLEFSSLSAGTNITITSGDTITINSSGGGSGSGAFTSNGLNTYTGGTSSLQSVNVSALTINTLTASGASSFTTTLSASTLSASTIISGSTNLYDIFAIDGQSVGTGNSIYKQKNTSTNRIEIRSLSAGTNITFTTGDTITINSSGGGTTIAGNYIGVSGTNVVSLTGSPVDFMIALSDETSQVTTGTNRVTIYTPYAFTLTGIKTSLTMSGSVSATTVDVKLTGTTIFTTKPTIDINLFTSVSSATQRVFTATTFPADSKVTFDITTVGTGTTGVKCYILGTRNL